MKFNVVVALIALQKVLCIKKHSSLVTQDVQPKEHIFLSIEKSSLYACGSMCLMIPTCLSINFVKSTLECTLNSGESVKPPANTVYMDKSALQRFPLGSCTGPRLRKGCKNRNEPIHDLECSIPIVKSGKVKLAGNDVRWPVGSKLSLECCGANCAVEHEITCGENNKWYYKGCPATCAALQRCNRGYGDGDYWLYPRGVKRNRVKMFCSAMNTTRPKEFVSLLFKNSGAVPNATCAPVETTVFDKIRVIADNMTVHPTDYTFATSSGTPLSYGEARACTSKEMLFKIDLRGTGFAVNKDVMWPCTSKTCSNVTRSFHRAMVTIKCIGDYATSCKPTGAIILDFYNNEDVSTKNTIEPICSL